jgi:predicted Zn-ribbon and HTH transcriptional regulator
MSARPEFNGIVFSSSQWNIPSCATIINLVIPRIKMREKRRIKEPVVPEERYETLRRRIAALLKEGPLTGKEISGLLRIPEKDVYEHLEHIRKTMNKGDYRLAVVPARCDRCGFVFTKRGRLKKPGKCPICRNESLQEPLFSVEKA